MDIYIDSVKVTTLDMYNSYTLYQQKWYSPNYTYGVHTVQFVNLATGGTYTNVDALKVLAVANTPTATITPTRTNTPTKTPTPTPTLALPALPALSEAEGPPIPYMIPTS